MPRLLLNRRRRGLSLAELLIAGTIMTMLAGGMGMLVTAVHSAGGHCREQTVAVQHGRSALDRIDRAVRGAVGNEQFPGCLVIATTTGGYTFPDTLVVWSPATLAADPTGLPRVSELLLFCPDPAAPNRLMEVRPAASDNTVCPALGSTSAWAALANSLKTAATSTKIELTDQLRTGTTATNSTGTPAPSTLRGCARFLLLMSPTAAEWASYRSGTAAWDDLTWPLDLYGTTAGVRRVACQTELQLVPGDPTAASQTAIPFFGSSVLTFEVSK
ncbi:MAG: hypothetical protein SFU86_18675 [Pirellulaceae bacterium]|nr:hypothetical protein [Pirellulaceae bacterium]